MSFQQLNFIQICNERGCSSAVGFIKHWKQIHSQVALQFPITSQGKEKNPVSSTILLSHSCSVDISSTLIWTCIYQILYFIIQICKEWTCRSSIGHFKHWNRLHSPITLQLPITAGKEKNPVSSTIVYHSTLPFTFCFDTTPMFMNVRHFLLAFIAS